MSQFAPSRPVRNYLTLALLTLAAVSCSLAPWRPDDASRHAEGRTPAPAELLASQLVLETNLGDEPTWAMATEGDTRVHEPSRRADRRSLANHLEFGVMPLVRRYHPRVDSTAKGSISLGTVTSGYLVDGVEVPVHGDHLRVLERIVPRQTRYTTHSMLDLLQCAADRVAKEHRGAVLGLGNLSRMGGGPLPWSVSHNNGRDADLAFYVRDSQGSLALADHLYHFDRRGRATDSPVPLTFDPEANWTLVAAILECPGPELQHLFVANWLKAKVLAVAAKKKADRKLILRAAALMHQPKKTLAHNDHLHLRIGCSRDDRSEGCVEASRAPQAAWGRSAAVRERLPAIRRDLRSAEASKRADAIYLIGLYRDAAGLSGVLGGLRDRDSSVRLQAVRALSDWGPTEASSALQSALSRESEAPVASAILHGLAELQAYDGLVRAMVDRRLLLPPADALATPSVQVRRLAASLLAEAATLAVAPALAGLLDDSEPAVRDTARASLVRLTNHDTSDVVSLAGPLVPSLTSMQPLEPAQERAVWETFLRSQPPEMTRDELALAGLRLHGVEIAALDHAELGGLVQALALPAPWRDNAAEWIAKVVAFQPRIGRGAWAAPLRFWPTWLVQRHMVSSGEVATRLAAGALVRPSEGSGGAGLGGAAADAD